jgi:hypothetical protein
MNILGIPLKKRPYCRYSLPEKSGELKQAIPSLMQIDLIMIIQNQSNFNNHCDRKN